MALPPPERHQGIYFLTGGTGLAPKGSAAFFDIARARTKKTKEVIQGKKEKKEAKKAAKEAKAVALKEANAAGIGSGSQFAWLFGGRKKKGGGTENPTNLRKVNEQVGEEAEKACDERMADAQVQVRDFAYETQASHALMEDAEPAVDGKAEGNDESQAEASAYEKAESDEMNSPTELESTDMEANHDEADERVAFPAPEPSSPEGDANPDENPPSPRSSTPPLPADDSKESSPVKSIGPVSNSLFRSHSGSHASAFLSMAQTPADPASDSKESISPHQFTLLPNSPSHSQSRPPSSLVLQENPTDPDSNDNTHSPALPATPKSQSKSRSRAASPEEASSASSASQETDENIPQPAPEPVPADPKEVMPLSVGRMR